MRRSSASKGQWFIISAVIISGALLAISFTFRGYFAADTSAVQLNDQSYYFYSINESIANVHASNADCATKQKDVDCTSNAISKKLLLVQSDNMEVWEGRRPVVSSLIIQEGRGKAEIGIPVNYEFNVQADVYSSVAGESVASKTFTVPAGATGFDTGSVSSGNYVVLRSVVLTGTRQFVL